MQEHCFDRDAVRQSSFGFTSSARILVGCHRSGTTLLRYLLDAHPEIACPPESKFIAGLKSFFEYPQAQRGLETLGVSRDALLATIRATIEQVFRQYADRRGKRRWIDKTPNYYTCLDFIDEVFEGTPLYLFLTRHPLDCIDSLERFVRNPTPQHEDPEFAHYIGKHGPGKTAWAHYWADVYRTILTFQQHRQARTMMVRYENLTASPDATLRGICEFIGEEYAPAMLTEAFRVPHDRGYEDDNILLTDRVLTDRVNAWNAWPSEETARLWRITEPIATSLLYQFGAGSVGLAPSDELPRITML